MTDQSSEMVADVKAVMAELLQGVVTLKLSYINSVMSNDRRDYLKEFKELSERIDKLNSRIDQAGTYMLAVTKRLDEWEVKTNGKQNERSD
jgi:hypothetical protein